MRRFVFSILALIFTPNAFAQDSENSIHERLNVLEHQLRELQTKPAAPVTDAATPAAPSSSAQAPPPEVSATTAPPWHVPLASETLTGLGPSASKIYFSKEDYVFGLSAEFFAFKQQNGTNSAGVKNLNTSNVLSLAPSLGLHLNKRLVFNTQLLLENGGAESSGTVTQQKGQVIVRTAFIDWLGAEDGRAGLRLGHQLVPIGVVNTSADPTTFFGVQRPELERELIPSFWHENGVTAWVDRDRAEIQAGVFSSLNATGFHKDTFLAGGRSQGQSSPSDDLMAVFRINARRNNVTLGVSSLFGNSAQGNDSIRAGAFQVSEVHMQVNRSRLQLLAMYAQGDLQDADSISVVTSSTVAEQAKGYSLQAATELLGQKQKLWFFVRHSHYNLHDKVTDGLARDPALDKNITTFGVSYFPQPNFVLKVDYANKRSGAGNEPDEVNMGAGFIF
ncbi:MAG: hypothetical protein KF799_15370 [Bdellovibrionales bacterium]|nr:hypothetical protein [Bdellovibrionales bacterium]